MILKWVEKFVNEVGQEQLRLALNELRKPGVVEVTLFNIKGEKIILKPARVNR